MRLRTSNEMPAASHGASEAAGHPSSIEIKTEKHGLLPLTAITDQRQ